MTTNRIMLFGLSVLIVFIEIGETRELTDILCTLNGRSYAVGETWHPVLKPFQTAKPCINCTCLQTGKIECKSEKCPRPDCAVPKQTPGQCCPTCEVETNGGNGHVTPSPGCTFHGEVYEHKSVFTSDKTALRKSRDDQCVMCVCERGEVLCHLKTCQISETCTKYVNVSDDCCPQCEENTDYEDLVESILSGGRPDNFSESDCHTGVEMKKNGETWHPLISTFGPDKCVTCQCQEGKVKCKRKSCLPDNKLPCRKPKQVKGECCKACPSRNRDRKKGCRRRKDKDGKRRKRCKKDRKGSRKNKSTVSPKSTATAPITSPPSAVFGSVCLPKRTDRFVYQMEERRAVTLVFDTPSGKTAEVLSWTVARGRLSEMVRTIRPSHDIRRDLLQSHILGATNKKNFKKFKRKLRKKLQRCKTPCRRKVIKGCLSRLKLKKVKSGKQCQTK